MNLAGVFKIQSEKCGVKKENSMSLKNWSYLKRIAEQHILCLSRRVIGRIIIATLIATLVISPRVSGASSGGFNAFEAIDDLKSVASGHEYSIAFVTDSQRGGGSFGALVTVLLRWRPIPQIVTG